MWAIREVHPSQNMIAFYLSQPLQAAAAAAAPRQPTEEICFITIVTPCFEATLQSHEHFFAP